MSDTFAVVMAGYQGIEAAKKDFDELVQLVKDKKVKSEGVILVEHDESGEVRVSQTGDHLGRKGMGWGGGVGVLVGLAAPPLLAAIGRRRGRRRHRRQVRQAQGRQRARSRDWARSSSPAPPPSSRSSTRSTGSRPSARSAARRPSPSRPWTSTASAA